MSTTVVIILVAVIVIAAVAFMMYQQKERRRRLQSSFGPEYDRVVTTSGDPRQAEATLERRQKRVEQYHLRPLRPEECDRFSKEWRDAQTRFVDDPRGAVADADRLVSAAMTARGYRLPDIETRIEDLSVEHPKEVESFRAAHDIAKRDAAGQASTEDLRKAMQHYRSVFESLIESRVTEEVRR
jgi:hypothetical protein